MATTPNNDASQSRVYSGLTRSQILDNLLSILKTKQGSLADLGQSSYGRTILEAFAGFGDTAAFWIDDAWKEGWLEEASTETGAIVASGNLGHSVRRPIPAKAGYTLMIHRTGQFQTVKIVIPAGSTFTSNGLTLTAMSDCEFYYDRTDPEFDTAEMKLVSGTAVVAEGSTKTREFFSDGTSKFQQYEIQDTTFSNWFGWGDPNYSEPDDINTRASRFTTIVTDSGMTDSAPEVPGYPGKVFWRLSRRGLYDPYNSGSVNLNDAYVSDGTNYTSNYTILVRTGNDTFPVIKFGDGVVSAVPYGKIIVNYFSTQGSSGNVSGVAGTKMTAGAQNIVITQINGSESDLTLADFDFVLTTELRGGMDLESPDEIIVNAPAIFNNLDSLGNRNSYISFLRQYTGFPYINAFGEDLLSRFNNKQYDIKYSNIVRTSLLKDLYVQKDGSYYVNDSSSYMVSGYKVNGLMYLWQYDFDSLPTTADVDKVTMDIQNMRNAMVANKVVVTEGSTQLTIDQFFQKYVPTYKTALSPDYAYSMQMEPSDFIVPGSELDSIFTLLNNRGYLTLGNGQHAYAPPTVHSMGLKINIVLLSGASFNDVKTRVMNSLYSYLKQNTTFSSPIYRSELEAIVQALPEVAGVNLTITSQDNQYSSVDLTTTTWLSGAASAYIPTFSALSLNGETFSLYYTYDYKTSSGTTSSADFTTIPDQYTIANQDKVAAKIQQYYTAYMCYRDSAGNYVRKLDITEKDLNKFASYVWCTAINEVYNSIITKYDYYNGRGDILNANRCFYLLESIKTWDANGPELIFKDTDQIKGLTEGSDQTLFQYISYTLSYCILIRNIFAPSVAGKLIDSNGNITQYSGGNEIVQFNIASTDLIINYSQHTRI
jgi:hypothetical protein